MVSRLLFFSNVVFVWAAYNQVLYACTGSEPDDIRRNDLRINGKVLSLQLEIKRFLEDYKLFPRSRVLRNIVKSVNAVQERIQEIKKKIYLPYDIILVNILIEKSFKTYFEGTLRI